MHRKVLGIGITLLFLVTTSTLPVSAQVELGDEETTNEYVGLVEEVVNEKSIESVATPEVVEVDEIPEVVEVEEVVDSLEYVNVLENLPEENRSNAIVEGVVLIEYENEGDMDNAKQIIADTTDEEIGNISEKTVQINNNTAVVGVGKDSLEVIKQVSEKRVVKNIQPIYNYKTFYAPTNDTLWSQQWYFEDQISSINAEQGWDNVGSQEGVTCSESGVGVRCGGDPNVKIAVIDTGVNINAVDFAGANIDVSNSMRFYNNVDNTCAPGTYYVGFNNSTPPPTVINFCQDIGSQFDEQGHGTGVASTIYAQDNSTGTVGVAHNTTLLPIAIHGAAFNTFFVADAVTYAVDNGADVINLSLGSPFYDSYLESAIDYAASQGVVVVSASGNCAVWSLSCDWDGNGSQTPGFFAEEDNALMYPAGFTNSLAIGASDYGASAGAISRSEYSNFGSHIDAVAPVGDGNPSPTGNQVLCGVIRSGCSSVDAYKTGFGTSYASPQAAGVIGLMLSQNPGMDISSVRASFSDHSLDIGSAGRDDDFGHGLIKLNSLISSLSLQVSLIAPTQGDVINIEDGMTIVADAVDTENNITNVEFYNGNELLGNDTTAPYSLTLTENDLTIGEYNLTAVVYNDAAGSNTSAVVTVRIVGTVTQDINGDGTNDLLWKNPPTNIYGYWNNGDRSQPTILGSINRGWDFVGMGRFDDNDRADLIWQHRDGFIGVWYDGVRSSALVFGRATSQWKFIGIGDVNGDDYEDLLWQHQPTGITGFWGKGFRSGAGILKQHNRQWIPIGNADFTNDNQDEILWFHVPTRTIGYFDYALQQGIIFGIIESQYTFKGIGDFDGNGKTDIMFEHNTTDVIRLWMDGEKSNVEDRGSIGDGTELIKIVDLDNNGTDDMIFRSLGLMYVWYDGLQNNATYLNTYPNGWELQ